MIIIGETVFVRIPKNASNSLNKSLKHLNPLYGSINGIDNFGIQEGIDEGLVSSNKNFIGIIREPFERLLSLYLYRVRQNRYQNLSIRDFRNRCENGFIEDHPWQMRLQKSFIDNDHDANVELWKYDNINTHFEKYGTLTHINKSVNSNIHSTKTLMDDFYNEETKYKVYAYWRDDFDLYHKLK